MSGNQEEQKASEGEGNCVENDAHTYDHLYASSSPCDSSNENGLSVESFAGQSIMRQQIVEAKNELDYLICPICMNILFKPISCSECTQSFCKNCIDLWIKPQKNYPQSAASSTVLTSSILPTSARLNSGDDDEDDRPFFFNSQREPALETPSVSNNSSLIINQPSIAAVVVSLPLDNRLCCPMCKKIFKGVNMPLIKKLLGSMKLSCFYQQNGCEEVIPYDSYEKHCVGCSFQGIPCKGCSKVLLKSTIDDHQLNCQDMMQQCSSCQFESQRKYFVASHTTEKCLQKQLLLKDRQIENLNTKVDGLSSELSLCVGKLNRLLRGVPELISSFPCMTVFTNHFKFEDGRATLLLTSFNDSKKKFDFLHFFLNKPFYIHSPVVQVFKVRFEKLMGNILMGVSDSQLQNSMDFMVNKQGEIKKKEKADNKYKQKDRAVNFTIQERNTIIVRYLPFLYTVEFHNVELNVTCKFDSTYMLEFTEKFYFFFSLDHQDDTIVFSPQ